jgi:hypothetical protein
MQVNDRDFMKVISTVLLYTEIGDLDNYLAPYDFMKRTSFHIPMQNPQLVQTMANSVASTMHVSQDVSLYMVKTQDSYHYYYCYYY